MKRVAGIFAITGFLLWGRGAIAAPAPLAAARPSQSCRSTRRAARRAGRRTCGPRASIRGAAAGPLVRQQGGDRLLDLLRLLAGRPRRHAAGMKMPARGARCAGRGGRLAPQTLQNRGGHAYRPTLCSCGTADGRPRGPPRLLAGRSRRAPGGHDEADAGACGRERPSARRRNGRAAFGSPREI
jgi:hypothetical protein